MHMPTVESLLTELFASRGYQVLPNQTLEGVSGTHYAVPIVAKASRDTVLVWTVLDASFKTSDAEQLTAAVHDTGSDLGVVVALAGAEPHAVAAAAHGRVEVWSRGRTALELGEHLLSLTDDAHPTLVRAAAPAEAPSAPQGIAAAATTAGVRAPPVQPVAASRPREFGSLIQKAAAASTSNAHGDAVFMPTAPRVRTEVPAAAPGPLGYAWGGGPSARHAPTTPAGGNPNATFLPSKPTRQVDQWGNDVGSTAEAAHSYLTKPGEAPTPAPRRAVPAAPAAAPAAPHAPQAPPPAPELHRPEAGQALQLKVDANRAAAVAATNVGTPQSARLVLDPAIAFTWAWAGWIQDGKPPLVTKGVLLVDAQSGKMREISDPDWQTAPEGERHEGRITAVDVYDQVKGRLAKLTTREVKVEREVGGESIFETKRLGPRSPDEMGLEHHGVVYCPTWVVSGDRGEARVDAFTGELIAPPAAATAGGASAPARKDGGFELL